MRVQVDIRLSRPAFELDVRFDTPSGVTVLFGPSGSGKTTVLNAIAGLVRPDGGQIYIGEICVFGQHTNLPPHKRRIGYVFQDGRLFPHMTVEANMRFASRFGADVPQAQFDAMVDLLDLKGLLTRYPSHLSGGEIQRTAIARALLSDPRLLCLDEPLASLDHTRKELILPYLERIKDHSDIPMIYVTHDKAEAKRLADQMIYLEDGKTL